MVAFPVYSVEYFRTLALPQKWLWTVQPKDAMVTNLSRETLQHLAAHGLYSVVADSAQKQRFTKNLRLSDHMCFPWLVMEHKKDKHTTEHCYCQAANGTSAAVLLLENLCKYETPSHLNLHIPPVIGITTGGGEVRVWITYSTPTCIVSKKMWNSFCYQLLLIQDEQKMDCIWTGDITQPVLALQLHCIFENIHSWATRVLRPRLSLHIDQWLSHHPFGSPRPKARVVADPSDQFTHARQNQQHGQAQDEEDATRGQRSPTMFGGIFDITEASTSKYKDDCLFSKVERDLNSNLNVTGGENAVPTANYDNDTFYKGDKDRDFRSGHENGTGEDSNGDSNAARNNAIEEDKIFNTEGKIGVSQTVHDQDSHYRGIEDNGYSHSSSGDSNQGYDGDIDIGSENDDDHDERGVDQKKCRVQDGSESGNDGHSTPHRGTGFPLSATPTFTGSTLIGAGLSDKSCACDFRQRGGAGNETPTKSSSSVQRNLSPPILKGSKSSITASMRPNKQLGHGFSGLPRLLVRQSIPWPPGGSIRVRIPHRTVSHDAFDLPQKRIMIGWSIPPISTSRSF